MYKSPITVFQSKPNLAQKIGDEIMYKIKMQVDVDKEELLKALAYDRAQYDKGYEDAKALYEKALDKACDELNYFQHKLYETEKILFKLGYKEYAIPDDIKARNFYEWKAWLLEDE